MSYYTEPPKNKLLEFILFILLIFTIWLLFLLRSVLGV